ncbi:MAG: PQQ-binding-like beta-propeller repeat protein [Gemmataceae bacterium]|nr:PQQ-binding-like beta-propeller repeat protein [Gemmataceae bacterium]
MIRSSLTVLLLIAGFARSADAPWPQWRGPTRDGQVKGLAWPDSLEEPALQQLWRVEFGPSYSGPIVTEDRVFTTETKDKTEEVVTALDRATGKTLWQARWPGSISVPFFARANGSWIRSTPAYDGENLYVAGIRDVLVCLSGADGKELWRVDFVTKFSTPLPDFGFVCSPLVDGDFVYVQAGASCFKLDKKTGKEVWRCLKDAGGMYGSAFSSPMMAQVAGRRQLLVQTRENLAGVDPESGEVLWQQPVQATRGMNILTPVVHEGGLFTSAYGGKTLRFDLTNAEGGKYSVTPAWTNKIEGYMSTPVVIDGHAYLHLRNQRIACVDLKTGKTAWMTDKSYGKYWNLVANGNKILALDERGKLFLLRANAEKYDEIDTRSISKQECWAHLAVAGDNIYVRELNALTAFRWK